MTYNVAVKAYTFAGEVIRSWSWGPVDPGATSTTLGAIEMRFVQRTLHTERNVPWGTYFTLQVFQTEMRQQGSYDLGGPKTVEQYVAEREVQPATLLGKTTKIIGDFDGFGNVLSESTATAGVDLTLNVTRELLKSLEVTTPSGTSNITP